MLQLELDQIGAGENGLTESECSVDTAGVAELVDAVSVRLSIVREDGAKEYGVGSESTFVELSELDLGTIVASVPMVPDERITVRLDWCVDPSAGNEIQSDSVSMGFSVTLRST